MSLDSARQQAYKLLRDAKFPQVDAVATHATTAMRFTVFEGKVSIGGSRIGGAPDVPAGFVWPHHNNTPLAFLLQLDLAEVRAAFGQSLLPDCGRLLFFYEAVEQPWGFDPKDRGAWRVIYDNSANVASQSPPPSMPPEECFPEAQLRYYIAAALPSPTWLAEHGPELDEAAEELYWELYQQLDPMETCNQLLGDPDPIQGEMELECQLVSNGIYVGDASGYESGKARALEAGAKDWVLLLQLDSNEDSVDMMWGDCGRLYFWIRKQDLRDRNFEAVWMVLQCT